MSPLRLQAPVDVIASLPYLFGYHPQESLLVLGIHDHGLGIAQRWDLPGDDLRLPPQVARDAAAVTAREGCDRVLLVAVEDAPLSGHDALLDVATAMTYVGVDVLDLLHVVAGRWRSLRCDDPSCCPAEGSPVPAPWEVPVVAEWVGRGVAPLADRSALVASIAPRTPTLDLDTRVLSGRMTASAVAGAWHRFLTGSAADCAEWLDGDGLLPAGRTRAEVTRLVRSCADVQRRDLLLEWLCPGLLPATGSGRRAALARELGPAWPGATPEGRERRRDAIRRLIALARRLEKDWAPDVYTVAAAVAWYAGEGTVARLCLDEALAMRPAHSLASLLAALIDHGVRPETLCA